MHYRRIAAVLVGVLALIGIPTTAQAAGSAPNPSLVATPGTVLVGQTVTADLSLTNDPDGDLDHCLVDWWDGSPQITVPCNTNPTHTYAAVGDYTPAVDAFDAEGNHAFNFGLVHVVAPAARFPGDPGPGKFVTGLNANTDAAYNGVQSHMTNPFMLRRSYNGNNWGVNKAEVTQDVNAGRIPVISWKLAPYGSPSAVPQTAVNQVCTDLKSYAPNPIYATVYHEPYPDIADKAGYRALFRNQVLTCRSMGVTNVAWTGPMMQSCDFGGCGGRDFRQIDPDWKGTTTVGNRAADWYTGTDAVLDMNAVDIYVGDLNPNPFATQMANAMSKQSAAGRPTIPWLIGELGIHGPYPDDPDWGTREMTGAWNTMKGNIQYVGASWWNTGGNRFCHASVPPATVDPNCEREQILDSITADPNVVHP